jgi:hypothetical protein
MGPAWLCSKEASLPVNTVKEKTGSHTQVYIKISSNLMVTQPHFSFSLWFLWDSVSRFWRQRLANYLPELALNHHPDLFP